MYPSREGIVVDFYMGCKLNGIGGEEWMDVLQKDGPFSWNLAQRWVEFLNVCILLEVLK